MLPRLVRAIIFDMDGLLLDTERLYRRAFTEEASALGYELPEEVFKQMIGNSWAASRPMLVARFGAAFDPEPFREAVFKRFYGLSATELALKSGVIEILDMLDLLNLPRAICTSSRREDVDHHLNDRRIVGRFDAVVAQGDAERGKPHPDPYILAASALGVAPADCLALEDSYNGVRAASAAGLMTIMVPDLLEPTEEMHSLCVNIAADLHEVRKMLGQQSRGLDDADAGNG